MDNILLRKFPPDDLEDLADLIKDLGRKCDIFHVERGTSYADITYGLLALGMTCGLDHFQREKDVKSLINNLWKLAIAEKRLQQ